MRCLWNFSYFGMQNYINIQFKNMNIEYSFNYMIISSLLFVLWHLLICCTIMKLKNKKKSRCLFYLWTWEIEVIFVHDAAIQKEQIWNLAQTDVLVWMSCIVLTIGLPNLQRSGIFSKNKVLDDIKKIKFPFSKCDGIFLPFIVRSLCRLVRSFSGKTHHNK